MSRVEEVKQEMKEMLRASLKRNLPDKDDAYIDGVLEKLMTNVITVKEDTDERN